LRVANVLHLFKVVEFKRLLRKGNVKDEEKTSEAEHDL